MVYLKAFVAGGFLCLIGQILIDKTKLTPARILVAYVVAGVVLGGLQLYPKFVDFARSWSHSAPDGLWQYLGQRCPGSGG